VYAALDVGAYNWANQGFSFDSQETLRQYRRDFKMFAAQNGVNLTDEDMMKFKDPVHFAAFKNGKSYIKTTRGELKLTQQQKETRSLTGVPGEHPLTADEVRSGKTSRIACHLGKAFMLGRSWHGTWDSKEDTVASRYAEAYYQLRDRAIENLETDYRGLVDTVATGGRAGPAREEPRPVTPRASTGSVTSEHYLRIWTPRGIPGTAPRSIRMTKQRIQRIKRWGTSDIEHFLRNANLTRAARGQVRQVLEERQRVTF
jgi:hypothetical protein